MQETISNLKTRIINLNNPALISILKHSPKYLSASAVGVVASLFMTKYYTAVFNPAAFGVLSLYLMLFQYMQNFIAFSVDASSQRVYFDYEGDEKAEFIGTVVIFMTGSALFWSIIALFAKNIVVSQFGGSDLMYISTIALTIVAMYVTFLSRIGYNEHLSSLIFRQGLIQTIFNHLSAFILIAQFGLGILGRQMGQVIAFFLNAIFYRKTLKKMGYLEFAPVFRVDILRRLFKFAIPAFSTTIIVATLSYLDRIFLNYYHGAAEVGIYSLSFTIGQGISFIADAVSMALFPSLMGELKRDYHANLKKLKQFDLLFCGGLLVIGIIMFLSRDVIIHTLSNKSYQGSADVLPFVVFTFVLGGFYKSVSTLLSFHSIVWFYPILSAAAFGVTAVLNYLLIPTHHEIGAAYAGFVGMLIYSLVIHLIGSKYFYRPINILIIYMLIFISVTYLFLKFANLI